VSTGNQSAGGGKKNKDFEGCQDHVDGVSALEQQRDDRQVGDDGDAREGGDPDEVEEVSLAEHADPAPARLDLRAIEILVDALGPVLRELVEGNMGRHDPGDVDRKGDEQADQARVHALLQHAGIEKLLRGRFHGSLGVLLHGRESSTSA
jgi:hypothetical protein